MPSAASSFEPRAYPHWPATGGGLSREKLFLENLGLNMPPVGTDAEAALWLMGTWAVGYCSGRKSLVMFNIYCTYFFFIFTIYITY
jgi:hypothetical protein